MWGRGAREQCGSNERCTGSIDSLKQHKAGGGVGWVREAGGGEVCDSCQCSHMSNTPMHDVHMLKVLVWTQ